MKYKSFFAEKNINTNILKALQDLESPKTKDAEYMKQMAETCFEFCCNKEPDFDILLEKLVNHPDCSEKQIVDLCYRLSPDIMWPKLIYTNKEFTDEIAINFIVNTVSKSTMKFAFGKALMGNTDNNFNQSLINAVIKNYTSTQYGGFAYMFTKDESLVREKLHSEIPALPVKRMEEICTHIINNTFLPDDLRYEAFEIAFLPTEIKNCTPEIQEALFQITKETYFSENNLTTYARDNTKYIFINMLNNHNLTPDQEIELAELLEKDDRKVINMKKISDELLNRLLTNTKNKDVLFATGSEYIFNNPIVPQDLLIAKFKHIMEKEVPYKPLGRIPHTLTMQKLCKIYQMIDFKDEKISEEITNSVYKYLVDKRKDMDFFDRNSSVYKHGYYKDMDLFAFARSLYKVITENPYAPEHVLNKIIKMPESVYHAHISRHWHGAVYTAKLNLELRKEGFSPDTIAALTKSVFSKDVAEDFRPVNYTENNLPVLEYKDYKKVENIIKELMCVTPLSELQEESLMEVLKGLKEKAFNDYMYNKNTDLYIKSEDGYLINLDYLLSLSDNQIKHLISEFSEQELPYFEEKFRNTVEKIKKPFLYEHAAEVSKLLYAEKTIYSVVENKQKEEEMLNNDIPVFTPPVIEFDDDDINL